MNDPIQRIDHEDVNGGGTGSRRDLTRFMLGVFAATASGLLLSAGADEIVIPTVEAGKKRRRRKKRNKPRKHLFPEVEFEIVNHASRTIQVEFWTYGGSGVWKKVSEKAIPRNLDIVHKGSPDELAWIDGRFYVWVRQFPALFPQLYAGYADGMTDEGPQSETQVVAELAVLVADRFGVDDSGRRVDIRRRPDQGGYTRFGIDFSII